MLRIWGQGEDCPLLSMEVFLFCFAVRIQNTWENSLTFLEKKSILLSGLFSFGQGPLQNRNVHYNM